MSINIFHWFFCSGLETFWQSAFAWFFRPLWTVHEHLWTMEPTELAPSSTEWPWHATTYSAKIRFRCNAVSSHSWTSKKGRVVFWNFWYRMRRQGEEIICQVLFKLYGQQCNKCMQLILSQQVTNYLWLLYIFDDCRPMFNFLNLISVGISYAALVSRRDRECHPLSVCRCVRDLLQQQAVWPKAFIPSRSSRWEVKEEQESETRSDSLSSLSRRNLRHFWNIF